MVDPLPDPRPVARKSEKIGRTLGPIFCEPPPRTENSKKYVETGAPFSHEPARLPHLSELWVANRRRGAAMRHRLEFRMAADAAELHRIKAAQSRGGKGRKLPEWQRIFRAAHAEIAARTQAPVGRQQIRAHVTPEQWELIEAHHFTTLDKLLADLNRPLRQKQKLA